MTIATVGGQAGGTPTGPSTSVTYTFPSNVSVGSLISIIGWRYEPATEAYVAGDCTKSAGTATIDTPTLDASLNSDLSGEFAQVGVWSCLVTGAGTLTMQVAGGTTNGFPCIACDEHSGNWDGTRVEDNSTNSDPADDVTPAHSGNADSAGAALFIGALSMGNNGGAMTIAPDGAFSTIFENEAGSVSQTGSAIRRIVGGVTTDRAEWTVPTTDNHGWAAVVVVYKESGGGSPTISAQPAGSSAVVGATTQFSVSSSNTDSYQWQYSTNGGETWASASGGSGVDTATYTTPAAVTGMNGWKYRCVLTNTIGSTNSLDAYFFVSGMPNTGRGRRLPTSGWFARTENKGGLRTGANPNLLRKNSIRTAGEGYDADIASAWADWFIQPAPTVPEPVRIPMPIIGSRRNRPGRGPYSVGKYFRRDTRYYGEPATEGDATIEAIGIPTAEAFGSAAIGARVATAGIASAEAIGSTAVRALVASTGIASAEALGTPQVAARVASSGIPSAEAIGAPALAARIASSGIASAEAIGTPAVGSRVAAAGVASAEAIGAPGVAARVGSAGIASSEAFGSPLVGDDDIIVAAGIPSAEAFGSPALAARVDSQGAASAETIGSPQVRARVSATGAATAEAVGMPTVGGRVAAAGIASGETVGTPAIAARVAASGVVTAEQVGEPIVGDVPPHLIECIGIASAEALGLPVVGEPPAQTSAAPVGGGARRSRRPRLRERILEPANPISVIGIESAEAFGRPTIGAGIAPRAIEPRAAQFGAPRVRRMPTMQQLADEAWLLHRGR